MRGVIAESGYREAHEVSMVFTTGRTAPRWRERSNGKSHGGISSGRISRALLDPGESSVLAASTPGASADVVQVALSRSGEDPRPSAGCGGQVSAAKKVPLTEDDLGRGGGGVLLQRTLEERVERVLHEEQVPGFRREEESSEEDRSDAHPGVELVQKSKTEGSNAANKDGHDAVELPKRRQRDRRLGEQRRKHSVVAEHRFG